MAFDVGKCTDAEVRMSWPTICKDENPKTHTHRSDHHKSRKLFNVAFENEIEIEIQIRFLTCILNLV